MKRLSLSESQSEGRRLSDPGTTLQIQTRGEDEQEGLHHVYHVDYRKRVDYLKDQIVEIDSAIERLNLDKERCLQQLSGMSNDATVQKLRNNSTVIARPSKERIHTKIVDVIEYMQKGTPMLKYGRFGAAKYHHFEVSPDGVYLTWYSKQKKKSKTKNTQVQLTNIVHMQPGHLSRQGVTDAAIHARAVSISYHTSDPKTGEVDQSKLCTLEVVARNKSEFDIWTKGLTAVLSVIRGIRAQGMEYDVDLHFPKTCYKDSHQRNQARYEKTLSRISPPPRSTVLLQFSILHKLYKATQSLMFEVLSNSHDGKEQDTLLVSQQTLLEEVKPQIDKIGRTLQHKLKSLSVMTYIMYDLSVQLKSLNEKLVVLSVNDCV